MEVKRTFERTFIFSDATMDEVDPALKEYLLLHREAISHFKSKRVRIADVTIEESKASAKIDFEWLTFDADGCLDFEKIEEQQMLVLKSSCALDPHDRLAAALEIYQTFEWQPTYEELQRLINHLGKEGVRSFSYRTRPELVQGSWFKEGMDDDGDEAMTNETVVLRQSRVINVAVPGETSW